MNLLIRNFICRQVLPFSTETTEHVNCSRKPLISKGSTCFYLIEQVTGLWIGILIKLGRTHAYGIY